MRVLAFDPGYERLGVAVIEKSGGKEVLLHSECLRTSAALSFTQRLHSLGAAVEGLLDTWQPHAVAIEKVFFEKNVKTAIQIAEVCGMLSYIASARGLPLYEYTPLEVKVAVTGYGKGTKAAVALMVPKLIALPAGKRLDDELDAIAIGLTCVASVRN